MFTRARSRHHGQMTCFSWFIAWSWTHFIVCVTGARLGRVFPWRRASLPPQDDDGGDGVDRVRAAHGSNGPQILRERQNLRRMKKKKKRWMKQRVKWRRDWNVKVKIEREREREILLRFQLQKRSTECCDEELYYRTNYWEWRKNNEGDHVCTVNTWKFSRRHGDLVICDVSSSDTRKMMRINRMCTHRHL